MKSFHTPEYGLVQILELTYRDGNTAVQLVTVDDGEDLATLSVNLPDYTQYLGQGSSSPKPTPRMSGSRKWPSPQEPL